MNIPERGLGRGLSSLLSSAADTANDSPKKLALSQVVPGKLQPRKIFDDTALNELAVSIKKQGIIQPLLVRLLPGLPQRYEIIAGERRWRAARMAGLTEVPVIVTEYSDKEAMTVALVENLQREDLNPMEEAEALQSLRDTYNLSQEELAEQLGKSRSAVANALRLLQLPSVMKEALARGDISAGHARALLAVSDTSLREQLYAVILSHQLSVRDAENAADFCKKNGHLPEKFSLKESAPRASRMPKPQEIKKIQGLIRLHTGTKATISGNEQQGRIQIPYTSTEELENLLCLLGIREK